MKDRIAAGVSIFGKEFYQMKSKKGLIWKFISLKKQESSNFYMSFINLKLLKLCLVEQRKGKHWKKKFLIHFYDQSVKTAELE